VTKAQRSKEESSDYRYFPDPDLVPVIVQDEQLQRAQARLVELPADLRARLQRQYELSAYDADVLVNQGRAAVDYFLAAADASGDSKKTSNWIQRDVLRYLRDTNTGFATFGVSAANLAELIVAVNQGEVPSSRAVDVFNQMLGAGQTVVEALRSLGIAQVDNHELIALCERLLSANPRVVADVQQGKHQAIGALVGQAKKTNPNVDPALVRQTCLDLIQKMSP
jgi:aspartyl-tRNA(Asn)/glutamyl-tRNA(Gln) amidotransferase subunit B